jgi:nickel/cobalt transporter regulator
LPRFAVTTQRFDETTMRIAMLRAVALAAMLALALPTLAFAEEHKDAHHGPAPHGGPPHPAARPAVVPHGPPPGAMAHPHGPPPGAMGHPGGPPLGAMGHAGAPFVFHGHPYAWHPVHYPHPWAYPSGYGYRLWAAGAILPPIFWSTPTYYYTGWDDMGLPPPDPGFQYVEYGPDLLLVNVSTGEVVQVFPGVFQ